MKDDKMIKLQEAQLSHVYGGIVMLGGGLILIGSVLACAGFPGFAVSEITSTVCVSKVKNALKAGNVLDGKKYSEIARRAKIAAVVCGAATAAGCILAPIGFEIIGKAVD